VKTGSPWTKAKKKTPPDSSSNVQMGKGGNSRVDFPGNVELKKKVLRAGRKRD